MAVTGAVSRPVAVQAPPAGLAVAHGPRAGVGLADAVQAVELPAGLAAWHHARLHPRLGEVLQLVVDVQVSDAPVEAAAIEYLPQAEGGRVHVHRHPWGGRWGRAELSQPWVCPAPPSGLLGIPTVFPLASGLCPVSATLEGPGSVPRRNGKAAFPVIRARGARPGSSQPTSEARPGLLPLPPNLCFYLPRAPGAAKDWGLELRCMVLCDLLWGSPLRSNPPR